MQEFVGALSCAQGNADLGSPALPWHVGGVLGWLRASSPNMEKLLPVNPLRQQDVPSLRAPASSAAVPALIAAPVPRHNPAALRTRGRIRRSHKWQLPLRLVLSRTQRQRLSGLI